MLQIMGILLGDKRLLTMANVIGDTINDPWKIEGVPRGAVKAVFTPRLYGSSNTPENLLANAGYEPTYDILSKLQEAELSGGFGIADAFKEFIITYVKTEEVMNPVIDGERFTVSCNRFKRIGDEHVQYDLYNTHDGRIKSIVHTKTKSVPDLEQFKRFWVTGLIHSLDSQIADHVAGECYAKYGWCIDIHDAYLINPESADDVRRWYGEALEAIYERRHTILQEFFTTIGIGSEAQAAWNNLMNRVEKIEGDLKVNPIALK